MRLPFGGEVPSALPTDRRAASIRGSSRTEFVREAAVRAAADVVMERAVITMSAAGFAAFAKAIAGEGKPVRELVKILTRKAPWE